MEYKNLHIKKIEFNETGYVSSIEFDDGANTKEVIEFLIEHKIGVSFQIKSLDRKPVSMATVEE